MDLILHHYEESNYAEKARLMLGLKGLTWGSVIIPDVAPKPDLVALTNGYSKTPVLQIGADVYCDTRRIADELEARYPIPTLFPYGGRGIADVLEFWGDGALTLSGGRYLIGRAHERWRPEFHADRAALWGVPVDLERMARSAERYRQQLVVHLDWLTAIVADGRSYLLGSEAGVADISAYHILWFLSTGGERATDVLDDFPEVRAWMQRMSGIGRGKALDMSAAAALDVAKISTPKSKPNVDSRNVEGLRVGETVQLRAEFAGRDPTIGALHTLTRQHVAISHSNSRAGEMVVHLPRIGYVVNRA
ncbi:MAG: glutathione S-transferase family protein [Nitrospirota bacterium]